MVAHDPKSVRASNWAWLATLFLVHRTVIAALVLGLSLGAVAEHLRTSRETKRRENMAAFLAFTAFTDGVEAGEKSYEERIRPALVSLQRECDQAEATSQIADALQWMAAIQETERRDRLWSEIRSKYGLPD
ncbi:MAG TPA: hypothetical protein VI485_10520 [Vicinamibacterales bacterium]|nr:hypothetical protein [Vicinamibacterales bacterium]